MINFIPVQKEFKRKFVGCKYLKAEGQEYDDDNFKDFKLQ